MKTTNTFTTDNLKAFETEAFVGDMDLIMGDYTERVINEGMFTPTDLDVMNLQEFVDSKHNKNGVIYNAGVELEHGDFVGHFVNAYLKEFFKAVNKEVMISTATLLWCRMFNSISPEGRTLIMKDINNFNHMLNYGDFEKIPENKYNMKALDSFAFLTDHEHTRNEHLMIKAMIDGIKSK